MSDHSRGPIDAYLASLARRLTTDAAQREAILLEVRAHLEEATDAAGEAGVERHEAETRAVAAFGSVDAVARRFNAVHPVHWDRARLLRGVAWGVVVTWFVWMVVTYTTLAYYTVSRGAVPDGAPGLFHPAWLDLLFYASPLGLGGVTAMRMAALPWLPTFIVLYGVVPFVWGMRAAQGWRPGLAFGLGGVLAFPWVLVAAVAFWFRVPWFGGWPAGNTNIPLQTLGTFFLLVPVAILASVLGSNAGAHLAERSARRQGAHVSSLARVRVPAHRLGIAALVVLLAVSVGAGYEVATWAASQPAPEQELAAAQAHLEFPLHLPGALPYGLRLTVVQDQPTGCAAPCAVYYPSIIFLTYSDAAGHTMYLTEGVPPDIQPVAATAPDYQVDSWSGGEAHATWWLGATQKTFTARTLTWTDSGVTIQLTSYGDFTFDQLRAVANSIT